MSNEVNLAGNELFGAILEKMFTDSAYTANTLLESYQRENADLRAKLAAVRYGVHKQFDGDYMPSEKRVISALYPSDTYVDLFRESETTD